MADEAALGGPVRQRFLLDGIRETGRAVGDGAYATVLEYEFRGLTCVGKKMHRLLYEHASPDQRAEMLQRFEEECELLSRLHHPSIVQFLGVYVEPGSVLPVLVMEYLPTGNLSGYLDRHGARPDDISYGILRDVALGLRYLHEHTPPIVHRDLSANNVLLTTSLSAKISDLGVAKILNLTLTQMTQRMSTKAPGTPCYMPPEALIDQPSYTIKIDSYSFGVMILHVLCGRWPLPTNAILPDPQAEGGVIHVTEVDRRAEYLQQIGGDHPLSGLVRQCLGNVPQQRPEAVDMLQQINSAMVRVLAPAEVEIQQLESVRRVNEILRGGNQILRRENEDLEEENRTLGHEASGLREENETLGRESQGLRETNVTLTGENETVHGEVYNLRGEHENFKKENETLTEVNRVLMEDNATCSGENQTLRREHQALREENETVRPKRQNIVDKTQTLQGGLLELRRDNEDHMHENKTLCEENRDLIHETRSLQAVIAARVGGTSPPVPPKLVSGVHCLHYVN